MHLSIQYRTQLIYGYIRPTLIFVTTNLFAHCPLFNFIETSLMDRQRHNGLNSRLRLSSNFCKYCLLQNNQRRAAIQFLINESMMIAQLAWYTKNKKLTFSNRLRQQRKKSRIKKNDTKIFLYI